MIVYHGTARQFESAIRENGLRPPPGHGKGVRVSTSINAEKENARAWSAYVLYSQELEPVGMIVRAEINPDRVSADAHGILRVHHLEPHEVSFLGPIKFREIDPRQTNNIGGEPPPAFFEALEAWERLTQRRLSDPFPRIRARRS